MLVALKPVVSSRLQAQIEDARAWNSGQADIGAVLPQAGGRVAWTSAISGCDTPGQAKAVDPFQPLRRRGQQRVGPPERADQLSITGRRHVDNAGGGG